jgi:Flp pilus assembly protein TadG
MVDKNSEKRVASSRTTEIEMVMRIPKLRRCDSGQALVETALVLPILMTVILNAVNFGYFLVVALNVAAAPRSGVMYSITGFATAGEPLDLPSATPPSTSTTVASLTYQDMHGVLASYTTATVQVCSKKIGVTNTGLATQTTNCSTCTSSSSGSCTGVNAYTPSSDPESPSFYLHRVDVKYTFTPLVRGTAFNLALLPAALCSGGTCSFHRQVSMRAMD